MKTVLSSLYLHVLLTPIGSSRMSILKIFENLGLTHKESAGFNIMCILASLFFFIYGICKWHHKQAREGDSFSPSSMYLSCMFGNIWNQTNTNLSQYSVLFVPFIAHFSSWFAWVFPIATEKGKYFKAKQNVVI